MSCAPHTGLHGSVSARKPTLATRSTSLMEPSSSAVALAVLRVDALGPERRRLVGVAVGGDHEVLVRIARARAAAPAGAARCLQPPQVGRVDLELAHEGLLQCTSVNGTFASSCGSNTA